MSSVPSSNSPDQTSPQPLTFEDLAASRREWIDNVLHPWCLQATMKQLRQAEVEWMDIAGRVDANATLWTWAWERFTVLSHPEITGVNETHRVKIVLQDGETAEGYPDSRQSLRGMLMLIGACEETSASTEFGPYAIDTIHSVERLPDA